MKIQRLSPVKQASAVVDRKRRGGIAEFIDEQIIEIADEQTELRDRERAEAVAYLPKGENQQHCQNRDNDSYHGEKPRCFQRDIVFQKFHDEIQR